MGLNYRRAAELIPISAAIGATSAYWLTVFRRSLAHRPSRSIAPRCKGKHTLAVALAALSWTWAGAALGMPITVNFDSPEDSLLVGTNLPDPFESADSNLIHFSHTTVPTGLFMQNQPALTVAGNGLFVGGDHSDGALLIEVQMGLLADEISLSFGNDILLPDAPGYQVVLTTYLDGQQVGYVPVTPNYDGLMNQTISFAGAQFDAATLKFDVDPRLGLAEAVDSVFVNVIPEPGAGILFGCGSLLVAAACGGGRPRRKAR